MLEKNNSNGFFIAVDGPNGVGKSTLIKYIKLKLEMLGYIVYITKEPTNTELGEFTRKYAEENHGISLACLVAADRYQHIKNEIIPELNKGKVVITDRYVLSSLILQEMDGVSEKFIFGLNEEIVKPDLQLAIFADEQIIEKRLSERNILTRFEKGNRSKTELYYLKKGIKNLEKRNINIMSVCNNDNLEDTVEKIVSYIIDCWRIL